MREIAEREREGDKKLFCIHSASSAPNGLGSPPLIEELKAIGGLADSSDNIRRGQREEGQRGKRRERERENNRDVEE